MKTLTINIPGDRDKLYKVIKYPAGEIQVRLTEAGLAESDDKDRYVIAANPIPDIVELAQLKDALDNLPNKWYFPTLELMYLPYARADRRFVPGDSYGLAIFARLINALNFHRVYTFDVHSSVAKELIPNLINLDPIHHYDQVGPVIKHLGKKDLCLIPPDKGARARYDFDSYNLPVLLAGKTRDEKTGALSGFYIEEAVKTYKKALIVDDICDGGGTFVGLAKEIHKHNPNIVLSLYVSHGIFSQGKEALHPHFKHLFVSDYSFRFPGYDTWEEV